MKTVYKRIIGPFFVIALLISSTALAGDLSEGIDRSWLNSLLSIEVLDQSGKAKAIGSGFLLLSPNNHVVLVTAKHVITDGKEKPIENLVYRINDREGKSHLIPDVHMQKHAGGWFLSKTDDVACRLIVWRDTSHFTVSKYDQLLSIDKLKAAAPILIPGFPLGLRSEQHADPIVRRGIVARTEPKNILIDAMIFPGNSGGPVLYFPTIKVGKGLSSPFINEERIIGLVSSQISYVETAISEQTKRPRITFEDNSGLCNVVAADQILELLNREDFKTFDASLK